MQKKTIVGLQLALCEVQQTTYLRRIVRPRRELQFDLLVLDEALSRLSEIDERQSDIVELHHFGGYSLPEVAHLLSLSVSTIRLEWRTAKAWLFRELTRE